MVDAGPSFRATNPRTGERLLPDFFSAGADEVDLSASLAHEAFATYSQISGGEKGKFLRSIAAKIESAVDELVERAEQESALPKPRLQSETARTSGQLRLFAQMVEEGSWVMARIDRADASSKPPKSDLRSMLHPLGPVVVFGASNFPLAFSVAGGDTASALAAGNPVIVKAHPAHPGTSELVGQLVRESVRECGLPEGVFSLLMDSGTTVGVALVKHPLVKAVGFTGSHNGGRALMDAAAARHEPIPVFAEMGSTNPVFILPGALRENGETISAGMYKSFTLGAGQFCTKPGLVFLPEKNDATATFVDSLKKSVLESSQFNMLTSGIRSAYQSALTRRKTETGVTLLAERPASTSDQELGVGAALFEADTESFLRNPELAAEVFGPATLIVRHSTHAQVLELARSLGGHLTATIHGTEADLREFSDLIAILKNKVGRLVFNGFPTGVEVSHAMVHGGPYPSTSDGRSTSVGSQAIFRFCRPVCYQGFPESTLPGELRNSNPLGIWRMVDGDMTREPLLT